MKDRSVRSAPWLPLFAVVISTWAVGACRRGDAPPQAPSTGSSNKPVPVRGTEKIVWDQIAKDATQAARYHYLAYVDDEEPVELGVICGPTSVSNTFTCSAPLPKLRPGRHRLQLAAEEADNQKRRGPKSGILLLDVVTRNP